MVAGGGSSRRRRPFASLRDPALLLSPPEDRSTATPAPSGSVLLVARSSHSLARARASRFLSASLARPRAIYIGIYERERERSSPSTCFLLSLYRASLARSLRLFLSRELARSFSPRLRDSTPRIYIFPSLLPPFSFSLSLSLSLSRELAFSSFSSLFSSSSERARGLSLFCRSPASEPAVAFFLFLASPCFTVRERERERGSLSRELV